MNLLHFYALILLNENYFRCNFLVMHFKKSFSLIKLLKMLIALIPTPPLLNPRKLSFMITQ